MSRRLLPLRALQALEAAARHLSFARAAKELNVTPAAISQQIKLLEDQIGQPLFERSPTLRLREQVFAAQELVGTAPQDIVKAMAPGGHIGLFMGSRTLQSHWPQIGRWLLDVQHRP